MKCPRCPSPLQEDNYMGHAIQRCATCRGVMLRQKQMIPLLDRIATVLATKIDLNTPVSPVQGPSESVDCPHCHTEMESHGYMGASLVYIDRCSSCLLVWTDASELISMARMYAQSQGRVEERKEGFDRQLEGMTGRVEARALNIPPPIDS